MFFSTSMSKKTYFSQKNLFHKNENKLYFRFHRFLSLARNPLGRAGSISNSSIFPDDISFNLKWRQKHQYIKFKWLKIYWRFTDMKKYWRTVLIWTVRWKGLWLVVLSTGLHVRLIFCSNGKMRLLNLFSSKFRD